MVVPVCVHICLGCLSNYVKKKISPFYVSVFHKCPACGKGDIYSSLLKVADKCSVCGFELKNHDAGDGPAFFAMFGSAILVAILASLLEVYFTVPIWLHMTLWIPLIIISSIYFLIVIKSFIICMEYKNNVNNFGKGNKK